MIMWFNLLKIEDPGSVGGMTEWHENARELVEEIKELGAEVKISPGDEPNTNKLIITGRSSVEINLYHPPIDSANEGAQRPFWRNTDLPAIKFHKPHISTGTPNLIPGELYSIGVSATSFSHSANTLAHYIVRMAGGPIHEKAREMLDGVINQFQYVKRVGDKIIIKPDWLKTELVDDFNRIKHIEIDLSNYNFCVYLVYEGETNRYAICLSPSDRRVPLDDHYATTILAAGNRATWKKMWGEGGHD
jgi:sporulation protein YlmC with PRC-barrel domain